MASTKTPLASSPSSPDRSPIFFYREFEEPYGFLCQWYPSPFTDAATPPTSFVNAEQYMMHGKAIYFSDPATAAAILAAPEPDRQKALGRRVEHFDNERWVRRREVVVEEGNYHKFTNPRAEDLRRKLLETAERELVEASPHDRIWGVGFGKEEAEGRRGDWGLNLLGKALMRVRERIRVEEEGREKGMRAGETAGPAL
ncbi:MAG: hypothetical protein M1827_002814 [Pycnora praestabilis]|nr:MAG: hypothetical protein M1827_002814 [Pycnora praestabilis]